MCACLLTLAFAANYKWFNHNLLMTLLSVQLEDGSSIMVSPSPHARPNQWEDRFLSKSCDFILRLPPDAHPNTYPPLLMSVTWTFPNTYTSCSVWNKGNVLQVLRRRPSWESEKVSWDDMRKEKEQGVIKKKNNKRNLPNVFWQKIQ